MFTPKKPQDLSTRVWEGLNWIQRRDYEAEAEAKVNDEKRARDAKNMYKLDRYKEEKKKYQKAYEQYVKEQEEEDKKRKLAIQQADEEAARIEYEISNIKPRERKPSVERRYRDEEKAKEEELAIQQAEEKRKLAIQQAEEEEHWTDRRFGALGGKSKRTNKKSKRTNKKSKRSRKHR
jgi:hypothetical protein